MPIPLRFSALLEGKIVKMDWELDAYLPFLFPLSRRFLQPRLFHLTLPTPFQSGCLQRSQTGKDSLLAFRQDSNLFGIFLRGLIFRKRVPTCTVCIDCLPQCPLTYLSLYWVPKHEQVRFWAQRNEHFRGLSFAIGQVKAGSVASVPSFIYYENLRVA